MKGAPVLASVGKAAPVTTPQVTLARPSWVILRSIIATSVWPTPSMTRQLAMPRLVAAR
jgi:hypothetical protein